MSRTTLLIFLLAAALVFSDLITVVRVDACPDERLPSLIGLPLPYRTSVPWVNSMSGVLYGAGIFVDLTFWALLLTLARLVLRRVLPDAFRTSRLARLFMWSAWALSGMVVAFRFFAIEWQWQWAPDMPFRCPAWSLQWLVGT
ncbi:MAG: hypothetical protein JNM31_05825 [Flavobacteriales bacterium]|nr:hypothetical protein [Flavobacteriales bacterium]